jgi:hypothetical protein
MKDKRHIKSFNEASENLNISDVSIRYSESEEMIQIINKDGKAVFGGNYWDFDTSPESFKSLFESLGLNVTMDDSYRYE